MQGIAISFCFFFNAGLFLLNFSVYARTLFLGRNFGIPF